MYATGTEQCPVRSLKSLLAKRASNATSLFNQCSKRAMVLPESEDECYTDKPVKHYSFTKFMGDISRNYKCSKSYIAHCLRATAIAVVRSLEGDRIYDRANTCSFKYEVARLASWLCVQVCCWLYVACNDISVINVTAFTFIIVYCCDILAYSWINALDWRSNSAKISTRAVYDGT